MTEPGAHTVLVTVVTVRTVAYVVLALVACYTDATTRTIHNKLTYPVALLGIVLALTESMYRLYGLAEPTWYIAIANYGLGLIIGFALMLPLFVMGGVCGGDVKLMAAAGALVGAYNIVYVLMFSSIVGVMIGLIAVIWRGRLGELWARLFSVRELTKKRTQEESVQPVPFGVAFLGGSLWAYLMMQSLV